jgi:hypothetical protein
MSNYIYNKGMLLYPKKIFEFMGCFQGFYKRSSPNNMPPVLIFLHSVFMEITESLKCINNPNVF